MIIREFSKLDKDIQTQLIAATALVILILVIITGFTTTKLINGGYAVDYKTEFRVENRRSHPLPHSSSALCTSSARLQTRDFEVIDGMD
ncbi:MAG: hypothetical protein HC932_00050 [Thermales bacterium]|nr:hypothetical protein [Thermales bacterium]